MPETHPIADDAANPISPPVPRSALFWDGTHWRVPRVDDHGRVQVRGEDQLHSFAGVLALRRQHQVSGPDGYIDSDTVGAGVVWHITSIVVVDVTTATTDYALEVDHDGASVSLNAEVRACAAGGRWCWVGDLWLDPDDYVRCWLTGALAADVCRVSLIGEIMTLET